MEKIIIQIILVLFLVILLLVTLYCMKKTYRSNGIYVKSNLDGKEYFVQDMDEKEDAANMLSVVYNRIFLLREYLLKNINKYPEYKKYNTQFCNRISKLVLTENNPKGKYTSYTVNKGDEIALCLRSKRTGKLHNINLIMYVVLHELSHVACPEIDHTDLFKKIFIFYLQIASKLGIYENINYKLNPSEYCGLTINENLLK